jgi:glycosyltransferase involved in cell wall biosynthesis
MESDAWLDAFTRSRGRPLRILHIGNIANNAYINAKIQRRAGIEADVVAYDYYHVMGCPEWEDADFLGDVGDESFPDWSAVDLRGFRRPPWFVQGTMRTCRRYLRSVRRGHSAPARVWWRVLRAERWLLCDRGSLAAGARFLVRCRTAAGLRLGRARRLLALARYLVVVALRKLVALPLVALDLARGRGWRIAAARLFPRRARRWQRGHGASAETGAETTRDEASQLVSRLETRYREHFPEREPLQVEDYRALSGVAADWRELMEEYDVVQAYGIDPLLPLLCDVPYAAYEHGTIREIPFEETPRGRLCALSYAEADAVFVTNIDNLAAARRLGVPDERIVALPHAVDSDRLRAYRDAHPGLRPPGDHVRIFSPSRQDWRDGDPSWTKGNDRLFAGFRRVLDSGANCRLTLVEWGRDLEASRKLIDELDLAGHVDWVPTLRKHELWGEYLRSHVVADQFVLPAFGSVTFEALALGRRVVTSLDVSTARAFFGDAPPVLVASSPDEVERALRQIVEDPEDTAARGDGGRDWFSAYHSSERILSLELEAYRRLLRDGESVEGAVDRVHVPSDALEGVVAPDVGRSAPPEALSQPGIENKPS